MFQNRKLHVIVLRAAAVLMILVALSTSVVAGRFARYASSASGSDAARVARFSVTQTNTDGLFATDVSIDIIPGGHAQNTIIVTNDSEVAVGYTIDVKNFYGNLPLCFTVDGKPVPYTGTITPGAKANYTLVTKWDGEKTIDFSGKVDLIQVSLTAAQID